MTAALVNADPVTTQWAQLPGIQGTRAAQSLPDTNQPSCSAGHPNSTQAAARSPQLLNPTRWQSLSSPIVDRRAFFFLLLPPLLVLPLFPSQLPHRTSSSSFSLFLSTPLPPSLFARRLSASFSSLFVRHRPPTLDSSLFLLRVTCGIVTASKRPVRLHSHLHIGRSFGRFGIKAEEKEQKKAYPQRIASL